MKEKSNLKLTVGFRTLETHWRGTKNWLEGLEWYQLQRLGSGCSNMQWVSWHSEFPCVKDSRCFHCTWSSWRHEQLQKTDRDITKWVDKDHTSELEKIGLEFRKHFDVSFSEHWNCTVATPSFSFSSPVHWWATATGARGDSKDLVIHDMNIDDT